MAELEDGTDFQVRIGAQCAQQETRIPVGLGFDQQDPRLLIGHRDKKRAPVVAGIGLAGQRLDRHAVFEDAPVFFLDGELQAGRPLFQIYLSRRHVLVLAIQIHLGIPVLEPGL